MNRDQQVVGSDGTARSLETGVHAAIMRIGWQRVTE